MMTWVLPENSTVQHVGLLPSNLPTSLKMTLTKHNHPAILCPPQHEVGICNPRIHGDNTPIIKSVFLCLPFFNQLTIERVIFIMTVLFEQPLRLVAPCSDIANSLNTVTRLFAKSSDGFTHFLHGITA
jgi:hypothetical protein